MVFETWVASDVDVVSIVLRRSLPALLAFFFAPNLKASPTKTIQGSNRWSTRNSGGFCQVARIVPFAAEGVGLNVESSHLGVGDLDALIIGIFVEMTGDGEPGISGSAGDQLDNDQVADQRLAAPVLGDERKQPMLSSRAGEFHPRALPEPYLKLSLHTAPDVRSPTRRSNGFALSTGLKPSGLVRIGVDLTDPASRRAPSATRSRLAAETGMPFSEPMISP
jgi:hypothetical protein